MIFEYDAGSDETVVYLNDEEKGRITGRIEKTRNGIPHPNTPQYGEFETILLQMSTPDERNAILHIIAGEITHS